MASFMTITCRLKPACIRGRREDVVPAGGGFSRGTLEWRQHSCPAFPPAVVFLDARLDVAELYVCPCFGSPGMLEFRQI